MSLAAYLPQDRRQALARGEDLPARAHGAVFKDVRPVNTSYVVAELLDPRWLLEIELEAVIAR